MMIVWTISGANIAQSLLDLAHKYSLDRDRDSPFALLAKENMILWRYGLLHYRSNQ
jgi:hypothetical protein